MKTSYIRIEPTEADPLSSMVRAENGDKVAAFQLQPLRALTDLEKEAVRSVGKNPDDYFWVGFPVPVDSEPVKWSNELQAKIKAAKDLLHAAAQLHGELLNDPNDPFAEMFNKPWQARHFLACASGTTEDEAEESATKEIAKYDSVAGWAGRWDKSGSGKLNTAKYSF